MKTAIISGITGQDGAYLSRFLLHKNYRVVGLIRSNYGSNLSRLEYLKILSQVELIECDLLDLSQVLHIIQTVKPDEIYNLAAQSSVALSFQQPIGTIDFNVKSVLNFIEAIRLVDPSIKFYQASSSEMFGKVGTLPITEETMVHPLSPYAISKVTGHYICINYRESYGLYTCSGILFNHESYLRGKNFFVKKLLLGTLDLKYGKKEFLSFGNLDIRRDFGWSEKYVEAMWSMLQQKTPEDLIICSGKSVLLRDIVEYVFNKLDLDLARIIIDPLLYRPADIQDIYGSSDKAHDKLEWKYEMDFFDVLDHLIEEEALNYTHDKG